MNRTHHGQPACVLGARRENLNQTKAFHVVVFDQNFYLVIILQRRFMNIYIFDFVFMYR